MRTIVALGTRTVFAISALVLWAGTAWAVPVYTPGLVNQIFFANGELIIDGTTGAVKAPGAIAVGDIVYGVLHAQSIEAAGTPTWGEDNIPPGMDTLTGYFANQVVVAGPGIIVFAPIGSAGGGFISFDPNGIFSGAELAAGVVMKLWTDAATQFTFGGSFAASIASAIDTALYAVLTMADTDGAGVLDPGYWYTVPSTLTTGTSFTGLNLLVNLTGVTFKPINDPVEVLANSDVEFYSQTELVVGSGECGVWPVCSNDPANVALPEPGSLLMVGLGLFGISVIGRRRLRK